MADTDVALANRALAIIGEALLSASLSENPKVEAIYASEREALLRRGGGAWSFAVKRDRLSAAGLLNCSSKVITIVGNTAPTADTISDDGSGFVTGGFEDGDHVKISGSNSNEATYEIDTVESDGSALNLEPHEGATSETLTSDTDLKLYALSNEGFYKYAKPSDCLRVLDVEEINKFNKPIKWKVRGKYIITSYINVNDQINMEYIWKLTDPTLFTSQFEECFFLKLCAAFSLGIKESPDQARMWNTHFNYQFLVATGIEAKENNEDEARQETSWQSAGR